VIPLEEHHLWPHITQEDKQAVSRVLERGLLSGPFAPEASAFEEEFASFLGARHAWMTHSGTSALVLALAAAGVGEGDEVLVPAYSFIATAMAVLQVGAVPIFVDVDPLTGLFDAGAAERWITPQTRAIMPVHVHGCPADLDAIGALATRHRLLVVEDAAQAHGATYNGKRVGALGHGGGFSLQSSKNLTCGEGGIYVTQSEDAFQVAGQVRNFGQDQVEADRAAFDPLHPLDGTRSMDVVRIGAMRRGNEMAAALARSQLRRLEAVTRDCQQNADRLSSRLAQLPGVTPPVVPAGRTSVHHKVRVSIDPDAAGLDLDRPTAGRAVAGALADRGVLVTTWEKSAQSEFQLFRARVGFGRGWPFVNSSPELLGDNYRAEQFPGVRRHLDGSFLLFTQSYPLIAQDAALVDSYADEFERLWERRHELVDRAPGSRRAATT
jgi:dTDP-4-amino-4,6-dideoxygalactose transaminase